MRRLAGSCLIALAGIPIWTAPAAAQAQIVGARAAGFATIQEAVDAAVQGDVILVGPGSHAGFTIDAKSLTIAPLLEGSVRIDGTVAIRNVPWSGTVLLSGLEVRGLVQTFQSESALVLDGNDGLIRLQSCDFFGADGYANGTASCSVWGRPGDGAQLSGNLRTCFVDCELRGGDGAGFPTSSFTCYGEDGAYGAILSGSAVAFYDCSLVAGKGGDGGYGGDGGTACLVQDFGIFASGSSFVGGDGGDSGDFLADGSDGGDSLRVEAIGQAQLLDDTYVAGSPGLSCCGAPGQGGQNKTGGGVFKEHPGRARVYSGKGLVVEGDPYKVQVTGDPGDLAFLVTSYEPDWKVPSPKNGIWLVPEPLYLPWPPLLTFAVAGTQTVKLHAPSAGDQPVEVLYLQGLMRQGPLSSTLGSALHPLVLRRDGPPDCNGNGTSDYVELLHGTVPDCDGNLVPDACDVLAGFDCNGNGIPDACDIASGSSSDCDGNGLPDECQPLVDCNQNGVLDTCDILSGTSTDCDGSGVPDECEGLPDCNQNGLPDVCDILNGTSQDLNGNGVPDECEAAVTYYVDPTAGPGGDGSQALPFDNIQAGIDAAIDGDEILLLDGVFTGPGNRSIDYVGKDVLVRSQNGAASCTVDLEDLYQGFLLRSGETPAARLEGVTITRGFASNGGAIFVSSSGATIVDCAITSCRATGNGGGIYAAGSGVVIGNTAVTDCAANTGGGMYAFTSTGAGAVQIRISDCVVSDCSATLLGGGVRVGGVRLERCQILRNSADCGGGIRSDHGMIAVDCDVEDNTATQDGGGCELYGGTGKTVVSASRIRRNAAFRGGGVSSSFQVFFSSSVCRIENCLIEGNTAAEGGGIGMQLNFSGTRKLTVSCSTVVGNQATVAGGGLVLPGNSQVDAHNSVFWGNAAPSGAQLALTAPSTQTSLTVSYSTVQGGLDGVPVGGATLNWGAGNLVAAPGFVNAPAGNFRLGAGSPCADAGNNALVPPDEADLDGDGDLTEPLPLDLDLTPRFTDDPVPDTGVGPPPVVDMGAYERP